MKILITNFRLAERTASELYVRDLARVLQAGGMQVGVFAPSSGELGEELRKEGVEVVDHPGKCGFRPDVIHGLGTWETMTALLGQPGVAAVFLSHGWERWREAPPLHPRVLRYGAFTRSARQWLEREWGIPASRVVALPDLLDSSGAGEPRRVPEVPGTALYCDWLGEDGGEGRVIRRACEEMGLRLDLLSRLGEGSPPALGDLWPGYDLVFARGRIVLEALAAGCAVVTVGEGGVGRLVTTGNFEEMAGRDFPARRPEKAESILVADLVAELENWSWACLAPLAEKTRAKYGRESTMRRVRELYEEVLGEAGGGLCGAVEELPWVADWLLEWGGQQRQRDVSGVEGTYRESALKREQARVAAETEALLSRLEMEKEKVRLARRVLREGNIFRPGLKRRIEEGWRDLERRGEADGGGEETGERKGSVDLSG